LLSRYADRRDDDFFDGNPLKIGELLPERVTLGGHSSDDAVRSSQLLHHHVEVPIERAKRGVVTGGAQGGSSILLLPARSLYGARISLALAQHGDDWSLAWARDVAPGCRGVLRGRILVMQRCNESQLCLGRSGASLALPALGPFR
jgi:hypothetical protein